MLKKTKIVAATALAVTGLAAAPQASADQISDLNARIYRLEQQTAAPAVNVQEVTNLNARMAVIEEQEAIRATQKSGNMVFFRGGYARNSVNRFGDILTDTAGISGQKNGGKDGWYVGAGFDFSLSNDLFGLHDGTEILAELMFEYKEFDRAEMAASALPTVLNSTVAGTLTAGSGAVTVSQFTLTAAPKIKFMKGSRFRPWIIPMGFALHVISPPSDGVTVLDPGMHFGLGADFRVWKDIYIGADARYNLTFGDLDGVDTEGFTAGGYVGIGF
ncbi:MAG: porin family protein [Methyloprofundus sp.]|nr:porin family protein [Methyloprofundus sp.]